MVVSLKLGIMIIVVAQTLLIFMDESSGVNSYPCDSHDAKIVDETNIMKVNLSVYYGSLCQPCSTFIIKNLQEIFYNGLINIINLQLVPWANAYINNDTNNSIICQNGPDECELNSVESCAINILNDVNKYYALIECLELLAIEKRQKNWEECFNTLGLPNAPIVKCHNTGNGTELGRKHINETALLHSPHTLLPVVVVNNNSIGKEYENFTSYVCNSYRGSSMPEACKLH
ncbi:gamma-interferon-responsive lysosomal thiol protein-like [Arachis stenosperma]|uniref:gamma-interferon-responsive lysosomal thiol protein-like n=1 Tax=Arachis stenosperma TaxID=217475 RepID=UPI0025ABEDEA|nr:gamma-interferon-responsive lysosomal thiol protein-like [Arachis stenosperma]